jgi:hypothetical protein
MFYGAMAVFTVKFWSVLWFIANWVDGRLQYAMYPDFNISTFFKGITEGGIYQTFILDILQVAMFVSFPLIWSGMMAWVGINVGGKLSEIMGKNSSPGGNMSAAGMAKIRK